MALGAKHVESPFIELGQLSTVFYFSYFIIVVPFISVLENLLIDLNLKSINKFSNNAISSTSLSKDLRGKTLPLKLSNVIRPVEKKRSLSFYNRVTVRAFSGQFAAYYQYSTHSLAVVAEIKYSNADLNKQLIIKENMGKSGIYL
jgi:hypothetical protein